METYEDVWRLQHVRALVHDIHRGAGGLAVLELAKPCHMEHVPSISREVIAQIRARPRWRPRRLDLWNLYIFLRNCHAAYVASGLRRSQSAKQYL